MSTRLKTTVKCTIIGQLYEKVYEDEMPPQNLSLILNRRNIFWILVSIGLIFILINANSPTYIVSKFYIKENTREEVVKSTVLRESSTTHYSKETFRSTSWTERPTLTTSPANIKHTDERSQSLPKRPAVLRKGSRHDSGSDIRHETFVVTRDSKINCTKLFAYDRSEIARVEQVRKLEYFESVPDDQYIIDPASCSTFISDNGFNTAPLSSEERLYPIAFGLRMHKDVSQVVRLLRTIYSPQNAYCIHVDLGSTYLVHRAINSIVACLPNVFAVSRPETFVYSGFSPVSIDLKCMAELAATGVRWEYFLNIAGQEFPLKTNLELVRILKFLNGSNDIESYKFPKIYRSRVTFKHRFIGGNWVATPEPKDPFPVANWTLYKGSSYNMFSRPFVEWVLQDQLAQAFINWTRDVDSPDEVLWATLNHLPQAPGGYPVEVVQQAKTHLSREVIWQDTYRHCHSERYIHAVCILSCGDLNWLSRRWEVFANKFDIHWDHHVLDCLEQWIRNKMVEADPDKHLNWSWMKRLPHVRFNKHVRQNMSTWQHNFVYKFTKL